MSCSLKVELKKQQELEKEKANEEKLRKQQIAKERFLGFFRKVEPSPSTKVSTPSNVAFPKSGPYVSEKGHTSFFLA